MPEISDAADTASYLATTEYLECRQYGHVFRPTHKGWITEGAGRDVEYLKRLRCKGCESSRYDYYDRSLEFSHRHYEYPDGYLVDGFTVRRSDANRRELEQHLAAERAAARAAAEQASKPHAGAGRRKAAPAARNLRAVR